VIIEKPLVYPKWSARSYRRIERSRSNAFSLMESFSEGGKTLVLMSVIVVSLSHEI